MMKKNKFVLLVIILSSMYILCVHSPLGAFGVGDLSPSVALRGADLDYEEMAKTFFFGLAGVLVFLIVSKLSLSLFKHSQDWYKIFFR